MAEIVIVDGWYCMEPVPGNWLIKFGPENRHAIVEMEARDAGHSHIGYWNGRAWEDIEKIT